jgi:murein L,D-transpeptidase YafK
MQSTLIFLIIELSLASALSCVSQSTRATPLQVGTVDNIIVEKAARILKLYHGKQLIQTYRIALGNQPIGQKRCEGDKRTPEGSYLIDGHNNKSHYHLSLHISYPNAADRAKAKKLGCNPGGDIMIHGLPNGYEWIGKSHVNHDWTHGCIAVSNQEIEHIWKLVSNGTSVLIKP